MPERLLTVNEAAARLGISRAEFYRRRAELIAKGLQERIIGHRRRYREASVDELIAAGNEATVVVA